MFLMAQHFPQVFDSQLSQIIERMPACVVAVCKHLRFESFCEYCAFTHKIYLVNIQIFYIAERR